jgi:hypothetical protein
MKKIFIILLINAMSVHISNSQTLCQQIENAYNVLDSVSYIEDIIFSYREDLSEKYGVDESLSYNEDLGKNWEKILAMQVQSIRLVNDINDSVRRRNINDSLSRIRSKIWAEKSYTEFISEIRNNSIYPVYYVLNLVSKDGQTLQVDIGKLVFNLFYFDKHFNLKFFILVENGEYVHDDTYYRSSIPTAYTSGMAKKAIKGFKKILRKNPKYLLYCNQFEGANTILYVLNDKIYVYRIIQMEEYELSDYIKEFGINE